MSRYVFEFSTACVAGEAMIECRVWRCMKRVADIWQMEEVGAIFAGTAEEALAEARILADEDRAIREFRG